MPMVTVPSLSTRAHSWESRYLRLLGMEDMAVTCLDQCFAIAHERILHDARGEELAADIDLNLLAGRRRHARETNRALQRRRERAAGHLACAATGHDDFLMTAQHAALFEHE